MRRKLFFVVLKIKIGLLPNKFYHLCVEISSCRMVLWSDLLIVCGIHGQNFLHRPNLPWMPWPEISNQESSFYFLWEEPEGNQGNSNSKQSRNFTFTFSLWTSYIWLFLQSNRLKEYHTVHTWLVSWSLWMETFVPHLMFRRFQFVMHLNFFFSNLNLNDFIRKEKYIYDKC